MGLAVDMCDVNRKFFEVGDRVCFSSSVFAVLTPSTLDGTVESITDSDDMVIRLDNGQTVILKLTELIPSS